MGVVVVGGGQAGVIVVEALRARGYQEPITLVEAGTTLPYQRPPLSKAYLTGELGPEGLPFRPESFFRDAGVELVLGERVTSVDRGRRQVVTAEGATLGYDHLVVATGSTPRPWPAAGAGLVGVHRLHDRADADGLREAMATAGAIVIIGGGFIGLEVASVAARTGLSVTVLEAAPRLMARSVSPVTSAATADLHRGAGVTIRCGVSVAAILGDRRVTGVELGDGERLEADLVLVGIGAGPALRADALGLPAAPDGSLLVDGRLRTADPAVLAAGDGASFRYGDRLVRLESVQNATDQARSVAATIVGDGEEYGAVPWFWTEQHGVKLQIAGLLDQADAWVTRGRVEDGRYSVFGFRDGRLLGAESVGAVGDHMATRTLLRAGASVDPSSVADPGFDLRGHAARITAAVKA